MGLRNTGLLVSHCMTLIFGLAQSCLNLHELTSRLDRAYTDHPVNLDLSAVLPNCAAIYDHR